MDKLSATTTRDWIINHIEFTAVETAPEGSLLVEGIVENPERNDVWYFGIESYEASDLWQLVADGYLQIFWPEWCEQGYGNFVVRLKLDDKGRFEVDGSHPADCVICKRSFNFLDTGDNLIETAPATGPTYSCGGTPPEYDSACTPCINAGPEEEVYECDFDDEF